MSQLSELEFLLVSNDYATVTAVSGGMKKYGAKFGLVPTSEEALDYVGRKRIDGIFVDMQVSGSLHLIEAVRKGPSNGKAAIFACLQNAKETTPTLNAGANFVLRKPLNVEAVALQITITKDIMLREKRQFFRHAVNLSVTLKDGQGEQRGRVTNLSEGGMAVRVVRTLTQSTVTEFALELSLGVAISGKGHVAWTSSEGTAGILFQTLHAMGRGYLSAWLEGRERLVVKPDDNDKTR